MNWDDIKGDWTAGWNYLWSEAQGSWKSLVEKNPAAYKPKVEAFLVELNASRKNLDAMKARLPNPSKTAEDRAVIEKYQALEKRCHELAASYVRSSPALCSRMAPSAWLSIAPTPQ